MPHHQTRSFHAVQNLPFAVCFVLFFLASSAVAQSETAAIDSSCHPIVYDSLPDAEDSVVEIKMLSFHGAKGNTCTEQEVFRKFKEMYCKTDAIYAIKSLERLDSESGCYQVTLDLYRMRKPNEKVRANVAKPAPRHVSDSENEYDGNVAVGYLIGGNTLIGISFEKRFAEQFGIHIGGGLYGFGTGVRFHFNSEALGPYVDLNFKDCGFGLMETIAVEAGGTLELIKDSGPHASIGLQYIIGIDPEFRDKLFGSKETQSLQIAIQVGWAWSL